MIQDNEILKHINSLVKHSQGSKQLEIELNSIQSFICFDMVAPYSDNFVKLFANESDANSFNQ